MMPLAVRAQGKVNGIVLEASGPASRHDGVGHQYGSNTTSRYFDESVPCPNDSVHALTASLCCGPFKNLPVSIDRGWGLAWVVGLFLKNPD